MKPRAAVVLILDDKIALIERHRAGSHYYVFPGGKIEARESPVEAALREAKEELGLEVSIGQMVAEIWYQGVPQYYFLATRAGGRFGSGTGNEMNNTADSEKGSYYPIWLLIDELKNLPILPKLMADFVTRCWPNSWPEKPFTVIDRPPDTSI
jgi:8-oxo-dGTP diphosphatase